MIQLRNIEKDLIGYIASQVASQTPITPHTDLVESKILDSMMMIDLVLYMESTFRIRLDDFDISPVHFRTIKRLSKLVTGKLAHRQDETCHRRGVDETRNRPNHCEHGTFQRDRTAN